MNYERLKKGLVSLGLAGAFAVGSGIAGASPVQAQDRDWRRDNRQERRDDWRQKERERIQEREKERERERILREQGRNNRYGTYRNDGYYGNGGRYGGVYGNNGYGGYNNAEVQRGYRDGLNRGQEDARSGRYPNPNNSSHYQSGNGAYREGFARGYQQGFRQYGGSRRW
ncbi:MAG TPA: hypothetical protein VFD58_13950 [Blastocatellia bacterium]|nr:hypothetical protein [Blastocatellia bacterium]